MKLLFHIILIFLITYAYSQITKTFNGCGKITDYREPNKEEDCKDSSEICCFISLKIDDNKTKKFCFPAPDKIERDDVEKEIKDYTGYNVETLTCFDFSEKIKFMMGNILLLGFILI